MLIPNIVVEIVGCLTKVINANKLHNIAKSKPKSGIKTDIMAKINPKIERAFILPLTKIMIFHRIH